MRRDATIDDKVALSEAIFGLNQFANAERLDVEAALGFPNTLPALIDAEIGETIMHDTVWRPLLAATTSTRP